VPPLRERRGDIPQLVRHFVEELGRATGLPSRGFEEGALEHLAEHDWPGNIRELKNAVERLLILAPGRAVTPADVERIATGPSGGTGAGVGVVGGMAARCSSPPPSRSSSWPRRRRSSSPSSRSTTGMSPKRRAHWRCRAATSTRK